MYLFSKFDDMFIYYPINYIFFFFLINYSTLVSPKHFKREVCNRFELANFIFLYFISTYIKRGYI